MPAQTPLRIAFAGCGAMARLHGFALSRVTVAHQIVGVQDRDLAIAREFAAQFGGEAFESLEQLLATVKPNVVHICTPAGTHFEPARLALAAGAHVYVEKPFQETSAESAQLLALARANGLTVCAGHQQLYDGAYRRLLERAPDLGTAVQVESRFTFSSAVDAITG